MSKWNDWKQSLGESRPWHLFISNKIIQDQSIIDKRMDICRSCEHFISLTTQCKKCGCIMKAKTTLVNAECPIGKWNQEPDSIEKE